METKGWVRGRLLCRGSCQLPREPNRFPYRAAAILRLLSASTIVAIALAVATLTGCGLLSGHHFALPAKDWQTRNGQLMYRTAGMTVTGEVLVRFSTAGDFELTFSKGPGVNLFTIQQDASYARVTSSLSHLSWSGRPSDAPRQVRGWLSLREKLIAAPHERIVRHKVGDETFVFRF